MEVEEEEGAGLVGVLQLIVCEFVRCVMKLVFRHLHLAFMEVNAFWCVYGVGVCHPPGVRWSIWVGDHVPAREQLRRSGGHLVGGWWFPVVGVVSGLWWRGPDLILSSASETSLTGCGCSRNFLPTWSQREFPGGDHMCRLLFGYVPAALRGSSAPVGLCLVVEMYDSVVLSVARPCSPSF